MIISLIEMQELPNFGHMTTFTIELHLQFESRDKILLVTCCYHVIAFISKYHHFKKAQNSFFADIIKIITIFIKTIFTDSKKQLKELEIMYQNACILIQQNLLISDETMLTSALIHKYFLDLLQVRFNPATFHDCRI